MIHITPAAKMHILASLKARGMGIGIKVGVRTAGCSGLAYTLEYVDTPDSGDHVFEHGKVNVFCDPKSLVYLDGLVMDFVTEGLNSGFKFINPNKKGECGCGESFTV